MRADLQDSRRRCHDSLFELYELGGLELMEQGLRGIGCDLSIRLKMSALTPERGEIINCYAVNRRNEDDEFDEWARP